MASVALNSSLYEVGEGEGEVIVCVVLSLPVGGLEIDVTVTLAASSGTAGRSVMAP